MKIPEIPSNFNSLNTILSLIENKDPKPLSKSLLDSIGSALSLGGIECENREEIIECLKILDQMEVLTLLEKQESTGISFIIGNRYNGK